MTKVRHTLRSRADLKRIWRYIAKDSPRAADRLLEQIATKIEILKEFPEAGIRRDDIRLGARMLVQGNYLVLYEHSRSRDEVWIVAVVEGMRNLSDLF